MFKIYNKHTGQLIGSFITIAEMSRSVGISTSTLYSWYHNQRNSKIYIIKKEC